MNVSIGERWESFVDATLREGRYASASEVVREGLRLVEEREARLRDLRGTLAISVANGGEADDKRLDAALSDRREQLRRGGVGV